MFGGQKQMQGILISIAIITLLIWYHNFRKDIGKELLIASIISFFWVSFSGLYNYSDTNFVFLWLNLFPFIMWTVGLVIIKEIYEYMLEGVRGKKNKKNVLIKVSILWVILVIVIEWIGYNVWDIQLASSYPGLFGFEFMHMNLIGKIYYLTIGPIFLAFTDWLKIK